GVRLRQHLARRLAAVGHAAQEAVALLVVAVAEQHRGQQRRADAGRRPEGADGAALGAHELGDRHRQALAAPALGPRRVPPPAVVHQAEPLADGQVGVPGVLVPRPGLGNDLALIHLETPRAGWWSCPTAHRNKSTEWTE